VGGHHIPHLVQSAYRAPLVHQHILHLVLRHLGYQAHPVSSFLKAANIYTTRGPAGVRPGPCRGPGIDIYVAFIEYDNSSGHRAAARWPEQPYYLIKTNLKSIPGPRPGPDRTSAGPRVVYALPAPISCYTASFCAAVIQCLYIPVSASVASIV